MSRRSSPPKREILPDPVYNSLTVSKFINVLMERGKKSTAPPPNEPHGVRLLSLCLSLPRVRLRAQEVEDAKRLRAGIVDAFESARGSLSLSLSLSLPPSASFYGPA